MTSLRDHGGGLDAAITTYGGTRSEWLDLSTGINPNSYSPSAGSLDAWTRLPDTNAAQRLERAAREFWSVPATATVIAAPGASALIARMPELAPDGPAYIPIPTYNEHAASFERYRGVSDDQTSATHVYVHPNNPDGRWWSDTSPASLTIFDESFCDIAPTRSHVGRTAAPGVIVLKSFGKFWGLAGLRLGFAIGHPETLAGLSDQLGPWPVSGPALEIGAQALEDFKWAEATRLRLAEDRQRLDALMQHHGSVIGGTDLFGLYDVGDATAFQTRLAHAKIWTRIFPYSEAWIRIGLPSRTGWSHLEAAL
ncbi:MAG: aminotransferase class I/II-fold pyridoxal phosphate-dependent enzyme [Pseudomonadota bacterium]